jgi:hypothetical protein
MTGSISAGSPSLIKPLLIFCATLLLGQIVLAVIGSFIDLGTGGTGASVAVTMAAAAAGGGNFAKTARRLMTTGEKFKFAAMATVAALILAIAVFYALFVWHGVPFTMQNIAMTFGAGPGEMGDLGTILPIILVVAAVVNILICFFAAGIGAKSQLRQLEKQGKL